jgi:peptidoglycan/LPS O-acetylase OafA/YrhL
LILTGYGFSVPAGAAYSIEPNNILKLFVVAVLVGGIVASRQLQALFESPLPVFLGRISFGVYLIHQPLESTVFARLYTLWRPQGLGLLALLIGFIGVSAIAGWAATLLVDEPVVRALKDWSRRYSVSAEPRFGQAVAQASPATSR